MVISRGALEKMDTFKSVLFVLVVFALAGVHGKYVGKRFGPPIEAPNSRAVRPDWGWIEQRVDHFNPADNRTWMMRFLNNSQFHKPGGPIFLYLGGEWVINPASLMTGQIFDLAKKHEGYMFYTEHRFYGESYPIDDLTQQSLRYLSADQALADVVYFVEHQKSTIAGLANSTVVVLGCSYTGSLTTWARLKYPHIFNVGHASSGPLRGIEDFDGYYEVVGEQIRKNSQKCYDLIREAVNETEKLLTTVDGRKNVTKMYNVCSDVKNTEPERSWFFNTIGEVFASLVQYAQPGQIKRECNTLLDLPGTPLQKLSSYYKTYNKGECSDNYAEFIKKFASTNKTLEVYRQWFYQSCTEYGYFQTTKSPKQPFGDTFPIDLYRKICVDLFGKEFTPKVISAGIKRTNLFYGSVDPDVRNLVTVHGNVDPWHVIGLTHNVSETAQTILVDGTSHCADLSSVGPNDLPQLKAAKLKAQELIAKWMHG